MERGISSGDARLLGSNQTISIWECLQNSRKMIALLVGVLLLGILLLLTLPGTNNGSTRYSYFLLTRRWPAADCLDQSKCVPALKDYQYWLIHGLWPENSDNTWDQFCTKEKFDESKVARLMPELNKYWPNLEKGKNNESLWKHEWEKHGTCTKFNQHDYFAKTIQLSQAYPIDQVLKDASIVPNSEKPYSTSAIKSALSKVVSPSIFSLTCFEHKKKWVLKEIMYCFRYDTINARFVSTTCTVISNCKDEVYYVSLDKPL